MRTIEFRCWHKEAKEMFYPERQSDCFRWKEDGQPMDIMQFTGLHDKNGVKIFEGDILADPDIYPQSYDNGDYAYSIIEFVGGKFCISYKPLINHFDDIADANDLIIVGNIHQNPELLEQ